MAEKGNALSRHPNVCASCSSLLDTDVVAFEEWFHVPAQAVASSGVPSAPRALSIPVAGV